MEVKWFSGSIAQAIASARQSGSIFVVVVTGDDEASETMKKSLQDSTVSSTLSSSDFVCIQLVSGSVESQQFGQFYPLAVVPSIYFIGLQGAPLEVAVGAINTNDLVGRIEIAMILHKKEAEPTAKSQAQAQSVEPTTASPSTSSVPVELRVEHAAKVLHELREKKEQEEREKEKAAEAERRRIGKELLKIKQAKQDKELEEIARGREKEKAEDNAARERVKQQIAQDRADRTARFQADKQADEDKRRVAQAVKQAEQQSKLAAEAAARSQFARLQFRLPDGSTRNEQFHAEQTLLDVRAEFSRSDESQTLRDLELAPSAVLLIIPTSASTPVTHGVSFIWRVLAPVLYVWGWVRAALFGFAIAAPPGPSPSTSSSQIPRATSSSQTDRGAGTAKSSSINASRFRQEGSIRRLVNADDQDEDENNTWNGNSTQQM